MSQEGTKFKVNPMAGDPSSNNWISNLFSTTFLPKSERKVGLEVERQPLWSDYKPFLFQNNENHIGAGELLTNLKKLYSWTPVQSPSGHLIGLKTGTGSVSLEPGSQMELSLDPCRDIHHALKRVEIFEEQIRKVTSPLGLLWLGIGVNPLHRVEDIDIIPSPRYRFMTDYFNKSGRYGTAMMRLTTSIQVNLDYSSEQEAIEMFRVAILAAPISYLLFSNSPFYENAPTGFLSFRSEVWRNTDPARTGLIPKLFERNFGFKELANYFWNEPLMFAQDKDGIFIPAHGKSLFDVSKEKSPSFPINENNQWNAIRELFPEARLKPGYLEVRSIDGLLPAHRGSAVAFWTGLLYGEDSRKIAMDLLGGLAPKDLLALWIEISQKGFKTKLHSLNLLEITFQLLKSAEATLKARGFKEENLLAPAFEILENRRSPGAELLDNYYSKWNKKMEKVIAAVQFPD